MTDHDLSTLLERASADLPELDFAEQAWAGALAARARRRRRLLGAVAGVAAVTAVVIVFQLVGSPAPRPVPLVPSTTTTGVRHLPDGTAYAVIASDGPASGGSTGHTPDVVVLRQDTGPRHGHGVQS